jgi:magnesium-transporting ATPase (P-type)
MATELQKLQVNELSGVEHPANEAPGWLVMKSADEREALLKEVDRMESDFAILYASLKAAEGYLGDAPEEVTSAASALVGYVESLFSEGEGEEPEAETETTDSAPEETVKTADTTRRSLTELIFGSVEKDADTDVEKDATVFDQEAETDEVEKDAETDEVEKDAEPEAEADVEKDAEPAPADDDDNGLLEVLSRLAQGQEDLAKNLGGDIGALRDALVSTIERVERLEVRKTGLDPDADAVEKAAADPLGTAVLAALSGQRINLS